MDAAAVSSSMLESLKLQFVSNITNYVQGRATKLQTGKQVASEMGRIR